MIDGKATRKDYAIAWECLEVVIKNHLPRGSWLAPIPEKDKNRMYEIGQQVFNDEQQFQFEF